MHQFPESEILFQLSKKIHSWYKLNQRDLPWRQDKDPYKIWISEIMLQQTTISAVIPYYNKFINKFPDLQSLAKSDVDEVIEYWSGLGYYSRARNLHIAANDFVSDGGIPESFTQLMQYPGLGPYTARAISSIAFEEKTGVLDGNVIRILTRVFNLQMEWWKAKNKNYLQQISDLLNQSDFPSSEINQGLMELGATICTPLSPKCSYCPWTTKCLSRKENTVNQIPAKKTQRKSIILLWNPHIIENNNAILLQKHHKLPFLKNQWMFPGSIIKVDKIPETFHFKHHITHYKIFVQISNSDIEYDTEQCDMYRWFPLDEIKRVNPSSLIDKCIAAFNMLKSAQPLQKK